MKSQTVFVFVFYGVLLTALSVSIIFAFHPKDPITQPKSERIEVVEGPFELENSSANIFIISDKETEKEFILVLDNFHFATMQEL